MQIAVISDTHCGARNSAPWMIEYQKRFYKNNFFPYLKKHDISHILHLGDYYENRKTAASVEAIMANKEHFVDVLISENIHMTIIEGNHDIYFKNTSYVSSVKTYLKSFAPSNITVIDSPETITLGGMDMCLLPWITEENAKGTLEEVQKTKAKYAFGHFEFKGFPMHKGGNECNSHHAIGTKLFKEFDHVYSGHFHTKSTKGNITYLGSQMEFTWADSGDPKFFHILDTETGSIEPVLCDERMFFRVEYKDDIDLSEYKDKFVQMNIPAGLNEKKVSKKIEELDSLAYETKVIIAPEEEQSVVIDMTSINDTSTFIKEVIDDLDTDLDKKKLRDMMLDVYQEAQKL